MPIPFIIAGVALAAGSFGAKKGYDAYQDYDQAGSVNKEARNLYSEAEEQLNEKRDDTQKKLEALGELKFYLYDRQLPEFIKVASSIKNIDFKKTDYALDNVLTQVELQSFSRQINLISDSLSSGVAALGGGGLAGLAAYSGAGWLATASTGTAISSLSGVAATNATLAWFGGGSIAAGGMGMAGGTMILGGIVAGPVLAVGGMMLASKAAEAKENAYSNLAQSRLAVEQMQSAELKAKAIGHRVSEIAFVLQSLSEQFSKAVVMLEFIVNKSKDFGTYSDYEKNHIGKTFALAKTIKNILDMRLLSEDGELVVGQEAIIQESNELLKQVS